VLADPHGFIKPFRTIRFYLDWARLRGGYAALGKNARLFMAPGMYHCNQGPGPNFFDALGALERWVEKGVAPEGIVATKYTNDERTQPALRTMPLCSFPTQARYSVRRDVNSATNWSCMPNEDLVQVGPDGTLAATADLRNHLFIEANLPGRGNAPQVIPAALRPPAPG
jgi:feruloyl esterase